MEEVVQAVFIEIISTFIHIIQVANPTDTYNVFYMRLPKIKSYFEIINKPKNDHINQFKIPE